MPARNEIADSETAASGTDVPIDVQRATAGVSHATGCVLAALFLLVPAIVYFGFFAILVIDELVLGTRYLGAETLPDWLVDGIVIVYYPLIVLVRWALGIE